jgi:hypothetical protein
VGKKLRRHPREALLYRVKRFRELLAEETGEPDPDPEPQSDSCSCEECGWGGKYAEAVEDVEGDYETGYYPVLNCPKCEDGGCLDCHGMSAERQEEWNAWEKRQIETAKKLPEEKET